MATKTYSVKFDIKNPIWVNEPSFFDPYFERHVDDEIIYDVMPDTEEGTGKPDILFECDEKNVWKYAAKHSKCYCADFWLDLFHEDAEVYDWEPIEVRKVQNFYSDGEPAEWWYEWREIGGTEWHEFDY